MNGRGPWKDRQSSKGFYREGQRSRGLTGPTVLEVKAGQPTVSMNVDPNVLNIEVAVENSSPVYVSERCERGSAVEGVHSKKKLASYDVQHDTREMFRVFEPPRQWNIKLGVDHPVLDTSHWRLLPKTRGIELSDHALLYVRAPDHLFPGIHVGSVRKGPDGLHDTTGLLGQQVLVSIDIATNSRVGLPVRDFDELDGPPTT